MFYSVHAVSRHEVTFYVTFVYSQSVYDPIKVICRAQIQGNKPMALTCYNVYTEIYRLKWLKFMSEDLEITRTGSVPPIHRLKIT